MKTCFAFILLTLITLSSVQGQEYKKFRVGLGLGLATVAGEGASVGSLWGIEPGYLINDKILVNIRLEVSTVVRSTIDDTGVDFDAAGIKSYTLNGLYYFQKNRFRPFAGIGFGLYSVASLSANPANSGTSISSASDTKPGFYPRIGFDIRHFTFCLDYNLVGNTSAKITTSNGQTLNSEFKNSYIGFRFGGYFGGGRK